MPCVTVPDGGSHRSKAATLDRRMIRVRIHARSQTTRLKPPTSATKSANSGHDGRIRGCPLFGVNRTSCCAGSMSPTDPTATLAVHCGNSASFSPIKKARLSR